MDETISKLYGEVVAYAQHLEKLLLTTDFIDEEALKELRKEYIRPVTSVAKDWVDK